MPDTEYFSEEEYDAEVGRLICIDALEGLVVLYHAVSQTLFYEAEETLSAEGYSKLTGFLFDNFERIAAKVSATVKLEDLENNTCSLVPVPEGGVFKAGTHFIPAALNYLSLIEDSLSTDYRVEVWR